MNLNQLLMWMVYVSSISLLIIGFKRGKTARGWRFVAVFLIGLTFLLQRVLPNHGGVISGAIWFLIVLIPQRGAVRINQLTWQQHFRAARRWAQVLRLLHPMDSFWQWPRYLQAMELAQMGQLAEAEAHLIPVNSSASLMGVVARCQLFRFRGDWQAMLDWMTQEIPKETVMSSGSLMTTYLMALGETHRLNEMIAELERFQPQVANATIKHYWDFSRLIVFAFCGQPELVARLLQGPLAKIADSAQLFWGSTAVMAAGEPEVAQKEFDQLIASGNGLYANTLRQRTPQADINDPLNDDSRHQLKMWGDALFSELQDRERQQGKIGRSPITLGLIAINLAFFIAEIILGSSANELNFGTDTVALYTLGALIPAEVVAGEWWRLLAAAFLHFGPLHLSLNMFGLALLGPFVEKMLGTWRFLVSYLTTAMGSMLALTLLTITHIFVTPAAVGASGAIMGVIGTEAAIQIRILRQHSSKMAATRLRLIGLFVVLQTIFDVMTPQVSFMGHVSGLVIGFGMGCLLKLQNQASMSRPIALHAPKS
ncbi:rhomboid family intramembrane serine protease [Acaryochloris sp. IP29b_bin.137]|uniref:rhomboid family intramembrane serine protease n=1 Tax=Acaryochloris sp. IP29b_bin.137 TaxID=2969217 RepID=UPI0026189712|nr:rhomboid family intramembrane serine protease [Acaryochloris sp. IP29b_bin.137]